ncbi:acetyl-CoA carboxylase carboxyl transferase subunit alpha [Jeotgalibaca ciconiae]|uniref:acetyl-CoA carboxytransferase n=1 Tax=Jeotgalibaca ciconiae TaxID=2496265 RepID=A0A3S9HDQ3_9LACT|nr:acetyl-CoA carboxylase carboxyl transferase subunit alpha [Jeotgalibaca ciconiae]AZP05476.1 acetyl-CoA carboxylase carboxyl transferase subunit alpha [Jeotgalibaca ciconiae]HJB24184.1 acetyl-CoA carboxylase carboxyl transferase subunit alpha [Candidatus Jeotgalibaca pullicola]
MTEVNEIIKNARSVERITTQEFAELLFENFFEMHGDRRFGDDPAIIGGVATLNGSPVTIIGTQKGRDIKENVYRNFGSPHPEGYRKSIRLMKQAEKFNRPIVTFINTSGAFCDVESEDRGIGEAIAESLLVMSQLTVPILSIFIGEGGSGGALGLAMGNKVWMMENTMYSVLSPEGFASILWKDSSRSKEAAEIMKLTPDDLLELQVIDKIIPESRRKVKLKREELISRMRQDIVEALEEMKSWNKDKIVEQRQARFRNY